MTELDLMRRELIAMRERHRSNEALTRRISIQIEQLREIGSAEGERRLNVLKAARTNIAEIAQIKRDGTYHNRLRELLSGPRTA